MPADRLFHPKLGHSEKIAQLSFFERVVWSTYVLAADDYGVLRKSATTIQAADEALDKEPKELVQAALERIVEVGLCQVFSHQGRSYLCQLTWQNEQRVKHPRDSMNPPPPADLLAKATPATQKLWSQHNLLRQETTPGAAEEANGNTSPAEREPDGSRMGNEREPNGSLARARACETANGYRLPANGLEGVQREVVIDGPSSFAFDVAARELLALYPAQGRCGWNLVERPLFKALTEDSPGMAPQAAWEALKARLERQQRSHQWRMKQMIPRLDRWLSSGAHLQELPERPPAAEQLSKSSSITLDAAAEILNKRSA